MANNLLSKGYPLVVYDVIESCLEGAVKNGAIKANSPAEVRQTACYKIMIVSCKTEIIRKFPSFYYLAHSPWSIFNVGCLTD